MSFPNSGATPPDAAGLGTPNLGPAQQKEAASAAKSKQNDIMPTPSLAATAAKTDTAASALIKSGESSTQLVVVPKTPFFTSTEPYTAKLLPLDAGLPIPDLLKLVAEYADLEGVILAQYANEQLAIQRANGDLTVTVANIDPFVASYRPNIKALNELRNQICILAAMGCQASNKNPTEAELTAAQSNVNKLLGKGEYIFCKKELEAIQNKIEELKKELAESIINPIPWAIGNHAFKQNLAGLHNIFLLIQEMLPEIPGMQVSEASEKAKKDIRNNCFLNRLPNYRPISSYSTEQFFKEKPNALYVIHNANLEGSERYEISLKTPNGVQVVAYAQPGSEHWNRDSYQVTLINSSTIRLSAEKVLPYLNLIPLMQTFPLLLHPDVEYYHPNTTREQAEKILANEAEGSYLLRDSSVEGKFAYSFKDLELNILHGLITIDADNQIYLRVSEKKFGPFTRIEQMSGIIGHFGVNPRLLNLPIQLHPEANSYHPNISREQAEKLMADEPNGFYLIRDSSQKGMFVITYKEDDKVKHTLIEFTQDKTYILSPSQPVPYSSIKEAILSLGLLPGEKVVYPLS